MIETELIVDGALDEHQTFDDASAFAQYADGVRDDYALNGDGTEWELYALQHGHDGYLEDCSCAQYETSGKPYWSAGQES